jgi:hypothetical protein
MGATARRKGVIHSLPREKKHQETMFALSGATHTATVLDRRNP